MGHSQQMFLDKPHWRFRHTHGGTLRQKRRGRKARPISNKTPIHLVFKADRTNLKRGFRSPLGFIIVTDTLKKYSKKFFVKVEQAAFFAGGDWVESFSGASGLCTAQSSRVD